MLSFLPPWDYCWKCEFDTDVKIENYCHYDHDGEQLGFYIKKITYQNTEEKALYYKKWRIPIYLTQTVPKRTSNAIFRGESRAAAASKTECFVIIVNGSLWPVTISGEINYEYPWIKLTK